MKAKIVEFKSGRKKSGDGIETAMFTFLKSAYRIQLPAYHGGKLIGKDCAKMMGKITLICHLNWSPLIFLALYKYTAMKVSLLIVCEQTLY